MPKGKKSRTPTPSSTGTAAAMHAALSNPITPGRQRIAQNVDILLAAEVKRIDAALDTQSALEVCKIRSMGTTEHSLLHFLYSAQYIDVLKKALNRLEAEQTTSPENQNAVISIINQTSQNNDTLLAMTAIRGDADLADQLIRMGANVNQVPGQRTTPLENALKCNKPDIAHKLLNNGAARFDIRKQSCGDTVHAYFASVFVEDATLWARLWEDVEFDPHIANHLNTLAFAFNQANYAFIDYAVNNLKVEAQTILTAIAEVMHDDSATEGDSSRLYLNGLHYLFTRHISLFETLNSDFFELCARISQLDEPQNKRALYTAIKKHIGVERLAEALVDYITTSDEMIVAEIFDFIQQDPQIKAAYLAQNPATRAAMNADLYSAYTSLAMTPNDNTRQKRMQLIVLAAQESMKRSKAAGKRHMIAGPKDSIETMDDDFFKHIKTNQGKDATTLELESIAYVLTGLYKLDDETDAQYVSRIGGDLVASKLHDVLVLLGERHDVEFKCEKTPAYVLNDAITAKQDQFLKKYLLGFTLRARIEALRNVQAKDDDTLVNMLFRSIEESSRPYTNRESTLGIRTMIAELNTVKLNRTALQKRITQLVKKLESASFESDQAHMEGLNYADLKKYRHTINIKNYEDKPEALQAYVANLVERLDREIDKRDTRHQAAADKLKQILEQQAAQKAVEREAVMKKAAQEQAAKEKAKQEQAEKEKAKQEQAAKEKAKRAQASKERAKQARADKAKAKSEQRDTKKVVAETPVEREETGETSNSNTATATPTVNYIYEGNGPITTALFSVGAQRFSLLSELRQEESVSPASAQTTPSSDNQSSTAASEKQPPSRRRTQPNRSRRRNAQPQ